MAARARYENESTMTAFVSVFVCLLFGHLHGTASAELIGEVADLDAAVESFRSNYVRITDWSGHAAFASYKLKAGVEAERSEKQIDFMVRPHSGELRCDWTFPMIVSGTSKAAASFIKCLYTKGELTTVRRRVDGRSVAPLIQVEHFPSLEKVTSGSCFCPLRYFGVGRGSNIAKTLTFYKENADDPKLIGTPSIFRQANIVTFRLTIADGNYLEEYKIDLDQGGNIVEYKHGGDEGSVNIFWTYENIADAWVPHTYRKHSSSDFIYVRGVRQQRSDLSEDRIETVDFSANRVNVSIADDEFTVERLEIQPGELVQNVTLKKSYLYKAPDRNTKASPALDEKK